LRFAKEVKKLGIPVLYYIVPQVWAWKPLRAKKMAAFVDRAFCVFDFEPPFFEKFGLKTQFVGHPLVDRGMGVSPMSDECGMRNAECQLKLLAGPKTVSLLPGSRESEFVAHGRTLFDGFHVALKKLGKLRAMMSVPDRDVYNGGFPGAVTL